MSPQAGRGPQIEGWGRKNGDFRVLRGVLMFPEFLVQ